MTVSRISLGTFLTCTLGHAKLSVTLSQVAQFPVWDVARSALQSRFSKIIDKSQPVTILLALLVAPFTVLTLCFAVEVFVGLRPLPQEPPPVAQDIHAVIIVPA